MNLQDILASQINEKTIKERIKREGHLVMQVVNHPGWSLIEGCLLAAKIKAENVRKKALTKATSGEAALYYSGLVDGVEEAKQVIFNVIKESEELANSESQQEVE